MATWRLAGAETLLVGDAVLPFARRDVETGREPDERVAVQALNGVPLVRVVAADLIPPGLALRTVLAGGRAADAEVELSLLGRGEVRRVVWIVESVTRGAFLRRAVDAYTAEILSSQPGDVSEGPGAILLTRARDAAPCDLVGWSRCVLGLPLSIELEPAHDGDAWCSTWRRVLGVPHPHAAV